MDGVDYSANPNQRTPCVLVLDASSSMGAPTPGGLTGIAALNQGLRSLEEHLHGDPTALTRVQLAIVSVGGPPGDAQIMMDWTDAENFKAFELACGGTTPLGKGLQIALDLVEEGKGDLKDAGIGYTRPWLMVITDGFPTDDSVFKQAAAECREAESAGKVVIFGIGVEGAGMDKLAEISIRPPLMLDGVKFSELFVWLSASLAAFSQSRPGDELQLPSTDPWRNVKV